jgi:hypothetical protein
LENSPLGPQSFSSIIVTGDVATWNQFRFPTTKRQWLADALKDAAMRAELRWQSPVTFEIQKTIHASLVSWAKANALDQVAAMRPEVGPLQDALPAIRASLAQAGVCLILTDRPEDLRIRHFASGGFFQFWERLRKTFGAKSCKKIPSTNPQLSIGFPP